MSNQTLKKEKGFRKVEKTVQHTAIVKVKEVIDLNNTSSHENFSAALPSSKARLLGDRACDASRALNPSNKKCVDGESKNDRRIEGRQAVRQARVSPSWHSNSKH